jgi:serine/threonine-protein kinase RsbW
MVKLNDIIEMKLPPRPEYLASLRHFFEGLSHQLGFSPDEVDQIVMAVDEALSNSVRYHDSWPPGGEKTYSVKVYVERDQLRIVVQDPGSDFGEAFDGDVQLEEHVQQMRSSGLGLFIIKSFMDEVSYKRQLDDYNELVMIKRYSHTNAPHLKP